MKHINNYDTEIKYYNKTSLNNNNYYNLYHDNLSFINNQHISLLQQTGITNNIIETNTQTTNYIGNDYLHNNEIATVILNPTPSINESYLWIPGVSNNVVPGLDSKITYIQSNYATLATLQKAITKISNNVQTELNNLEIPHQGNSNVNKELYYNTTHTDYTFQRHSTTH